MIRCLMLLLVAAPLGMAARADGWQALHSLIGEWTGVGSGTPGQGSGGFSFKEDLQGKVLVRKNRAEYPATKDRPAFVHDDLMIVYHESADAPAHAIYFDSEGHVIHYGIHASEDGAEIVFESAAEAAAPRYRLTYTRACADQLKIRFEIAPPGHASEYKTYIEAAARRSAP